MLRARHLALATDEPDAAVAAALDDAAAIAADRGASASAAELAEAALRLTPPDEVGERHRRALAAARAHRACGEWTRARTIASELLEDSGLGALRADVLLLLAELEGLDRAVALLEEALREATSRPALQAAIQCRLAWSARFGRDSTARSSTRGRPSIWPIRSTTTRCGCEALDVDDVSRLRGRRSGGDGRTRSGRHEIAAATR